MKDAIQAHKRLESVNANLRLLGLPPCRTIREGWMAWAEHRIDERDYRYMDRNRQVQPGRPTASELLEAELHGVILRDGRPLAILPATECGERI